mmetsp:Transcript_2437/g.3562  ORF Transcript_2437/g.3562 Transcript_2437/m.3562 type:complete len:673 (+) Transcript_2437:120-2138(+)
MDPPAYSPCESEVEDVIKNEGEVVQSVNEARELSEITFEGNQKHEKSSSEREDDEILFEEDESENDDKKIKKDENKTKGIFFGDDYESEVDQNVIEEEIEDNRAEENDEINEVEVGDKIKTENSPNSEIKVTVDSTPKETAIQVKQESENEHSAETGADTKAESNMPSISDKISLDETPKENSEEKQKKDEQKRNDFQSDTESDVGDDLFKSGNGSQATTKDNNDLVGEDDLFSEEEKLDDPFEISTDEEKPGKKTAPRKLKKKKNQRQPPSPSHQPPKKKKLKKLKKTQKIDEVRAMPNAKKSSPMAAEDNRSERADLKEDSDSDGFAPRTKEDDDFIAYSEEDDPDLLAEYNKDPQPRRDPDSEAEEEKKVKKRSSRGSSNILNSVLKSMRPIKAEKLSLSEKDAIAEDLMRTIDNAAYEDELAVKNKRPALAKLKNLDKIKKILRKQSLWETFLEVNLLSGLKSWVQAYEDTKILPSLDIRTFVYQMLTRLPIEKEHLRRSKLGVTIMANISHPEETLENKKMLQQLVERWSRMVFGKGTDARYLARVQEEEDLRKGNVPRKAPRINSSNSTSEVPLNMFDQQKAQVDIGRREVKDFDPEEHVYRKRPASRIDPEQAKKDAKKNAQDMPPLQKRFNDIFSVTNKKRSEQINSVSRNKQRMMDRKRIDFR